MTHAVSVEILRTAAALKKARSLFVLTGAGMSAESGLPTFRGAGGYWKQHRVEDLASPQGFERDPVTVWRWYNERLRGYRNARPNAGHEALARLETLLPVTIATQNVDSLHIRAGSKNVLELHGNLREARCTRCDARVPLDREMEESRIDHFCGGRFRPEVVWFGEALPAGVFETAAISAARADVVLVVGTSAQVYPAAQLAFENDRALVVEINPERTPLSDRTACHLRISASVALPCIVEMLAT